MAPNYLNESPKRKSEADCVSTSGSSSHSMEYGHPHDHGPADRHAKGDEDPAASSHGPRATRTAPPKSTPGPFASSQRTAVMSSTSSPGIRRVESANGALYSLDRSLLQRYDEVRSELARMSRMSSQSEDFGSPNEFVQVQRDIKKLRRNSLAMIQSQKELLEKMEKQERNSLRRFFTLNREQKMEKLKAKLGEKLSESVAVDEELQRLERKSDTLLELRRTSLSSTSLNTLVQNNQLDVDTLERMEELEKTKEDLLSNLCSSSGLTDMKQMRTRLAMYSSELKASDSIRRQVERCASMYRQALQLLRRAVAAVVAAEYSGNIRAFVNGPYAMAVEAGHLIEAASHLIQPESCRRYRNYAPELIHVRPPKFPQAVMDFARRARTHFDPNSALSIEAMRKLETAEGVVMLMQRIVLQKLEVIEKWRKQVERDMDQAETAHRKLEARLEEQMQGLARSMSV